MKNKVLAAITVAAIVAILMTAFMSDSVITSVIKYAGTLWIALFTMANIRDIKGKSIA